MGPQPFGCGRLNDGNVEQVTIVASMGPQPFGCGRVALVVRLADVVVASMGPQPFGCGRIPTAAAAAAAPPLQWGRNLSVAEGEILLK